MVPCPAALDPPRAGRVGHADLWFFRDSRGGRSLALRDSTSRSARERRPRTSLPVDAPAGDSLSSWPAFGSSRTHRRGVVHRRTGEDPGRAVAGGGRGKLAPPRHPDQRRSTVLPRPRTWRPQDGPVRTGPAVMTDSRLHPERVGRRRIGHGRHRRPHPGTSPPTSSRAAGTAHLRRLSAGRVLRRPRAETTAPSSTITTGTTSAVR